MALFFSISFNELLLERGLGATEQGSDGRGIEFECRRQLFVAEALTAEHEKPGITPAQDREDHANLLLLFRPGSDFFRSRDAERKSEQTLEGRLTRAPPQLVEALANSRPVEPGLGLFAEHRRVPPQLQKDLNREFLRACGIADDPCKDAGDAL